MSEPITAPPPAQEDRAREEQALARPAPREVRVVESDIHVLDTARFEQMQRIASLMAEMTLLPDHLVAKPYWWPKGAKSLAPADLKTLREGMGPEEWARSWAEAKRRTAANCVLVVEQAFRWELSPFPVAAETYEVGGKLGYQGKLVHAVVEARADLARKLDFAWDGEGLDRAITITGYFRKEPDKARVDRVVLRTVKTDNKMWTNDPDQKLLYTGVTHWARRYCPGVLLGISTVEDLEIVAAAQAKNITPSAPSTLATFAEGGKAQPAAPEPAQETKAKKGRAKAEPEPEAPQEAGGEAAAVMQEVAGPPEEAEEGVSLTAEDVEHLKAAAAVARVSWDEFQGAFAGGPVLGLSLLGKTRDETLVAAEGHIAAMAAKKTARTPGSGR